MPTVGEQYGSGGNFKQVRSFCAGIECEIESVLNGGNGLGNFECVQDGSLRNGGWEYRSVSPMPRESLISDFKYLQSQLKFKKADEAHSERTSTHVHVNVSSLPLEHARNMVLLYALFEEFFFSMVKPERRDNIHCVPLTETYLPNIYNGTLDRYITQWHKYTALNLKRMLDLGTMEFRHLHGTNDPVVLDQWLHVLENLWKVSQKVEISVASLSDKPTITGWFEAIFFPADRVMMLKPSLFDIIKNSLIDVKFSV